MSFRGRRVLPTIVLAGFFGFVGTTPALAIPEPCDLDCPTDNNPPTVSLSADPTTAVRGQTITFTADAQDADEDPIQSEWDTDDDGDYDDGTDVFQVQKAFSTLGTHTVRVRISDGFEQDFDSVEVTIVNRAPTATFTKNPTSPKTGEQVTFTSTAGDPDGDPLTHTWDLDNDTVFGEVGETGSSVSRSFTPAGTYPVSHRVTDIHGAQSTTTQHIAVANRAPSASFTIFPEDPLTEQLVTFDSTGSSDQDGVIASRAWDLDNDGAFDDGASTTASRMFELPGTYTVRLKVVDNLSAEAVLQKTVTVGNRLPTASFTTTPAAPMSGSVVQFDGSASSDPEDALTTYEWDFDGDGDYDATGDVTASHAYAAPGTYTARLRVTDAHGGQAVTTRTVTVGNRLPTASFTTTPAAPVSGSVVQFDGSASSDPEDALTTYEWDFDGDGDYDATTGAATTSHAYAAAGTYTARLRVTDAHGGQAVTTRTVTVAEPPDETPNDTTAPETTIDDAPKARVKTRKRKAKAKFVFSASEPGSTFECKLDKAPFEPCSSPKTYKVRRGKHTFKVRATDEAGNTDATPAKYTWKVKRKR